MPHAKAVVLTLTTFGKSAQAVVFTVAAEIIPASREDLMPISLVADVPYQLIIGGIEAIMQGDGELDHSQAGREMTTMNADRIYDILPQFGGYLVQLFPAKLFKVGGGIDRL